MTDSASGDSTFAYITPRSRVFVALGLAIFFVAAVIGGAWVMMQRHVYTPVAMGPVHAPAAESAQCLQLASRLPEKLPGYKKVSVVDPAPAGTGAFRDSQGEELTVRCGISVPDQYTVLSRTRDAAGARWLEVPDATPGSALRTWYSVGSSPAVAVTSTKDIADILPEFSESLSALDGPAPTPGPYPLGTLRMVSPESAAAPVCQSFLDALPATVEGYERTQRADAPSLSATYLSTGAEEPVVIRCGAALPESYRPGEKITQVDSVAWFADPSLSRGSTSGLWYALSHEQIVAVSMPNSAGNELVSQVTRAISETMRPQPAR